MGRFRKIHEIPDFSSSIPEVLEQKLSWGIEFSENLPVASGPVLILGGGMTTVEFRVLRWTDSVVDITPPGGLDIDQWVTGGKREMAG